MKPRLPRSLELQLPPEIIHVINTFLPHLPRPKSPPTGLQRELERLQKSPKNIHTAMYLKGLEDFILK
jgi:hypothetical protein